MTDLPLLIEQLAQELWDAEQLRAAIEPLSVRHPGLRLGDAYEIQTVNRDRRLAAGERIAGYKIGLTSKAMQEMLGVDTPDVGYVTERMVVPCDGSLAADELLAGRIEAEFAFRLGAAVLTDNVTLDDLRAVISHVAVSVEIIDSRIRDWRIGLIDTVADNASSARIVVGGWVPATPELFDSLLERVITLTEDGQVIGEGPGSAVLGDPLEALCWLANTLSAQGTHLQPEQVVLAGSVHRMQPLIPGRHYEATCADFPAARLTVQ